MNGNKKIKILIKFIAYTYIYVSVVFLLITTGLYPVFAYVMESNNYRIQSDSLNIGGARQTSDNYIMRDTIGEIATGPSESTNYKLKAGYQQMQEVYLSVSSPDDVTMTPNIPGVTGNPGSPSTGDATWTVKTDNAAGFTMSISASSDPAMRLDSTWNFSDYSPVNAGTPDFNWATPDASAAEFGFTVEPKTEEDTVQLFLDNGSACDISGGSQNTDTCWYNLATTDLTIINRGSRTDSDGQDEKVKFQCESNAKFLQEGYYQATITVTVATN